MSIEIVNKLKPIKFRYNDIISNSDNKVHMGFIAQDLLEIFGPEYAVVKENDDTGYLTVSYHELIAVLVKSIQELSQQVSKLENQTHFLEVCLKNQENLLKNR